MGLAAAAKALKKAELVKEKVQVTRDLLTDNEIWVLQQQLLGTYRRVLILDLEFALDKKVEQDLWNHAFKNYIASLQTIAKDKKHPKRPEGQAMLHWCLEAAAGFYLCLLQEVCSVFNLDLPFRRNASLLGCKGPLTETFSKDLIPSKSSIYYICQHCLVHLGDIARYRNQNRQAETFYRYAVMLSPTSGQPYNQLAILEASRGDKVSAVFHYVRAVALAHPFSAAATNLSRAFEKHSEDTVKLEGHSKLSPHEYLAAFLKMHGLLHSHTELETAEKLVQILLTSLTAHIATESLPGWKLVQIVAINIFALQRVQGGEGPQFMEKEMTGTEIKVINLISHFMAGCLNAFLLPVYTIKNETHLLEYFAMPAIKLTMEYIRLQQDILQSPGFSSRRQIWPSLCCLLKQLPTIVEDFTVDQYHHVPLPEDRDLQGFLPFEKAFHGLNFHTDDLKTEINLLNKLRATRLISLGTWLAEQTPPLITQNKSGLNNEIIVFEPVGRPEHPADLLREFEELSLGKGLSPSLSEGSGSLTGTSSPDSNGFLSNCIGQAPSQESLPEKRGILKIDMPADKAAETKYNTCRGARNVALTAIMNQKITDDVKQVTFKMPSPTKETTPKISPSHKKGTNQTKQVKALGDVKAATPATRSNQKSKSDEVKPENATLLQQQKLLDVLVKGKSTETKKKPSASNSEIEIKKEVKDVESFKTEQTQQKQQLLSALFDDTKVNQQPKVMSGLLNLNKQQQELLSSSKQPRPQPPAVRPAGLPQLQPPRLLTNLRPTAVPGQQRVVEKMEAARKEYEDAMFILQQRKQEAPEMMRYPGEGESFSYDRMFPVQNVPPPVPQSHMFVPLNQAVMGLSPMQSMQPFTFKLQPGVMVPWQEPKQPPMPPASWWTDRMPPPPPHMLNQGREPPGYRQPPQLSTYSLFSNPMAGDADPNMHVSGRLVNQQSFWSGPGPSPLERLLEQQRKQMRDTEPNT